MTWTDDVFELFFKPDPEGTGYYEFQVNALGTRLDMFIPERVKDLYLLHKSDRKFAYSAKVIADGTLNDASDGLSIHRSSLLRTIRNVEAAVSEPLLAEHRRTAPLRLTPIGHRLLRQAKQHRDIVTPTLRTADHS